MKQGRASVSGPADRKVEPNSRAINPRFVADLGLAQGNHATDSGTFKPKIENPHAGRGYSSPNIRSTSRNSGSQGKY